MKISYAAICEAGLRTGENQDHIFCTAGKKGGLFLVADGMGGHEDGAAASRTVAEAMEDAWINGTENTGKPMHPYLLDEELKEALKKANRRIRSRTSGGSLSGSTAVCLRVGEQGITVFSCGDSRCLKVNSVFPFLSLVPMTVDDVWENDPENRQRYSLKELECHRNRGKLLRAVGTETDFSCDLKREELRKCTLFALMSDGIYKYMDEKELKRLLKRAFQKTKAAELAETAEQIRQAVYENNAPDNLSLILVRAEPG